MQNVDIYLALQNDIVSCELQPSAPLQEIVLADRYSCGRTKIREALLTLAFENFVVLEPNKGAIVAPLDVAQVFSIFEMRIAVEKATAVLAAKRISEADSEELARYKAIILDAEKAKDEELFYKTDRCVHELISKASLNRYLQQQLTLMRLHTKRCWYFYRDRGLEEFADYEGLVAVIDAITARNPEEAAASMFRHLAHFHREFSAMLGSQIQGLEYL